MTPRQMAGLPAAFASIGSLSGGGLVAPSRWVPGVDGPTGERRRVEAAALRPDRPHVRPLDGPPPAAARRGITQVPIPSTIHPGERETRVGSAVTPGGRDTPLDREPVVHRSASYDAAGRLARRVTERPRAVPARATAEAPGDRDDPAGGPKADRLVAWSVPDGGDPTTEAVPVGRGVRLGGGAVPATAAR